MSNQNFHIPIFDHTPYEDAAVWAEKNMWLRDSGKFSFDKTPYFREPTKACSDLARVCRVVVCTPAQSGKTSMMTNVLCHAALFHPCNSLIILDTMKTARRYSKNRLKPALRDFAHVQSLVRGSRVQDKSQEAMNISLGTGANLILGGSSSASDLCSTPVQLLLLDELDRFERDLSGEGDPVTLALKRQLRFRDSMAILTSTPTTPDGLITQHYKLGTQEVWCAVCHCGEFLPVPFDELDWSGDKPTTTCHSCGEVFTEEDIKKLPHRYAPPKNDTPYKDISGRVCRSFKFTATLMHGIYTWTQIKRESQQAESLGESAVRSFRNTTLGEVYINRRTEIKNYMDLMKYRYNFDIHSIPDFVTEIFIGVDTQDSLFESVIIGVNDNTTKICLIEHKQILGDLKNQDVWDKLKAYVNSFECQTTDGRTLKINLVAHDAGGHFYYEVLSLGLQSPLWRPVRGRMYRMNLQETTVIDKISRVNCKNVGMGMGKVDLTFVNARYTKDLIYSKLSRLLENRDSGLYISSSPSAGFDENFFEELTSETKQMTASGYELYVLKTGFHNECLDCLVYAIGASELYRLALHRLPSLSMKPLGVQPDKLSYTEQARNDEFTDTPKSNTPKSNTPKSNLSMNNISNNTECNNTESDLEIIKSIMNESNNTTNNNNNNNTNNTNNLDVIRMKKIRRMKPL